MLNTWLHASLNEIAWINSFLFSFLSSGALKICLRERNSREEVTQLVSGDALELDDNSSWIRFQMHSMEATIASETAVEFHDHFIATTTKRLQLTSLRQTSLESINYRELSSAGICRAFH